MLNFYSTRRHLVILSSSIALGLGACSGDDTVGSDTGDESATHGGTSGGSDSSSGGGTGTGTSAGSDSSPGSSGTGNSGTGDSAGDTDGASTSGGDSDGTTGDTDDTTTGDTTTTTGGEELCDDIEDVTLFLSPDDSNSMSSPVQAREAVLNGWSSLNSVPLRMWEFFNYYTFEYPTAEPGTVIVTPELYRLDIQDDGEYTLQIGISSTALTNNDRAPMNITLVLDESGSMNGAPMKMQKEACRALAAQLKIGDIVSMVGWDTENAIKLAGYKVTGPNDAMLLAKINALEPGGGTDLHGGLVAGYKLAQASFDPDRINRVVLISDGGANAGITDINIIAEAAGNQDEDGIYLVGVGVGSYSETGYNDALMDTVTDIGKGASVYIPSKEEAWRIFGDDFVNTMSVAVRDVQVRLDMPPGFEIVKFSGEEYSDDPSEIEPQHLAPNDAMVFHQTIATCAPELIEDDTPITVTARFKDAITFEVKEVSATVTFGELLGVESPLVRKGSAVYAYVDALKAVQSNTDAEAAISEAQERLDAASLLLPGDSDLAEIGTVLEAL